MVFLPCYSHTNISAICAGYFFLSLQDWQVYCERQPLRFLDRQMIPQMAYALMRLGKFVGKVYDHMWKTCRIAIFAKTAIVLYTSSTVLPLIAPNLRPLVLS